VAAWHALHVSVETLAGNARLEAGRKDRGDKDHAFEWLERAYAQRDPGLTYIKVNSLLQKLKGDPRYAAWLRKLNLPE
jgi:hypothetical protein